MRKIVNKEHGFSLIELLVVMLILGILAAIAIPLFTNQQKTNRDRATSTDVIAISSAMRAIMIQNPSAARFGYDLDVSKRFGTVFLDLNGDGVLNANEPHRKVNQDPDTKIGVSAVGPGVFRIYGWNSSGKEYTSQTKAFLYDSGAGGVQKGTSSSPVPAAT